MAFGLIKFTPAPGDFSCPKEGFSHPRDGVAFLYPSTRQAVTDVLCSFSLPAAELRAGPLEKSIHKTQKRKPQSGIHGVAFRSLSPPPAVFCD